MSICQIYDLCAETLWLGRYGENGARDIAIDVGRWFADLGTEGTVVLVNWRPGEDDTPYNPNITMDSSKVVWSPSSIDLAISGRGFAELRYYIGNALAKSKTFRTVIDRTPSEGANPPSAAEDWLERMEDAAVTAQTASETAVSAAETATEGAQAVAQALPTVTQAAQTATTAAATATNAATEAAASEEVASVAANAAQTASESATAASQTAVGAATTATAKAAQAVEAAGTATTKASEATQAATTATANAQTSTVKAGEATTAAATATSKATEATTAASTASAAATTATGAASTATNAASTATAAKTAAQTAQTGAETAQSAAESAAASVTASAEQIATNTSDISAIKADLLQLETTVNYRSEQIDITPQALLYTKAYITSGGVITVSPAWDARIMFADEITKFKSINVSAYQVSSGRKQVAFYSSEKPSNDDYISGIAFVSGANPSVIAINKADIPNGTKSVLFMNLVSGGNMSIVGELDTNNISDAGNAVSEITSVLTNDEKAKFDNRFNYICYSDNGASGGIAINTEEMYVWAGRHDFVGIKGDVRLSSDGQIVMCHDAGFTLDENGHVVAYDSTNNIKINTLTYAECIALTHPNGEHVCGIDALVRTCKMYGKVAYITVRDGQIWDIAPKLFESLDKYTMRDRAIINSFTLETLKIMRKFDNNIMLSWVQGANHIVTTSDVDEAVKLGNALICGYDYGNGSPTGIANQSQEVIDYAKQKGVRFYEAIVTNDTSLNQLYDRSVVGAQIEYLPSCLTY